MGITGLLPVVKPICESKHVKEFARTRVGIDVYCWLHKGIYTCASKLCRGVETTAYVDYCMHRVRMLLHHNVTPVLVFDGADLPMKADTHAERRIRREDALLKAESAYAQGDFRKAEEHYQRACPVTSEMARHVIRQCRKLNVEYVVAPYEADAQLAWMVITGYIDTVITEDSDLLVYGATKVFYKMNKEGQGELFQSKNLPSLETIALSNFSEDMFMYMCVCAGCDFFKGVNGLGIRKAHALVRRHRTLHRLIHAIRLDTKFRVSNTFSMEFVRACLVFRHQTVFNMRTGATMSLRELSDALIGSLPSDVIRRKEDGTNDLAFLGSPRDPAIAKRVAEGHIHPRSLKEYEEPLDIVERPIASHRGKQRVVTPLKRDRSPERRSQTPGGFAVHRISTALQAATTQAPTQQSTPLQRPSSFRATPNLRQRLSMPVSNAFNPRREAQKFRLGAGADKAPSQGSIATSAVWNKFRLAGRGASSTQRGTSKGNGPNDVVRESAAGSSLQHESADSINIDIRSNELAATGSSWNGDDLLERAHQISQAEDQEVMGTPSPKRPRRLPLSANRVNAVKRAIGKFAVASDVGKSSKFCNREERPRPRPPSPDADSFRLFDEIDQLSRERADTVEAGSVKEKPPVAMTASSKQVMPSRPTHRSGKVGKGIKKITSQSSDRKQRVRVSRFFAPNSSTSVGQKSSDNGGEASSTKSRQFSPSEAVRVAMGGLPANGRRRPEAENIDNLRRGAAGKKIPVEDGDR